MFRYKSTDGQPLQISIKNEEDESSSEESVKSNTNNLYFYADVDTSTCMELNKHLRELDKRLRKVDIDYDVTPRIKLRLNTYGGEIMAAFSSVDTIRDIKTPVDTYIEGCVASAGTLISGVGARRYMYKNAHLLIHQMSSGFYGKYSEFEDEIYNVTNMMKMLKDFYKEYTKLPMKKLDEILKRDIWLNANECLEYGIIDEII
jgi:ATP-dependent Clp endopeptidase proteolytic subunit ClpP